MISYPKNTPKLFVSLYPVIFSVSDYQGEGIMTINQIQDVLTIGHTIELTFAGDNVRLAGQLDYPDRPKPEQGYPLLFVLHHAGCNARADYGHYARMGLMKGYAVFRWDKRGMGRSGASGRGSTTQDAVNAYEIALSQPGINRRRLRS